MIPNNTGNTNTTNTNNKEKNMDFETLKSSSSNFDKLTKALRNKPQS
jgi:hypothetical protein